MPAWVQRETLNSIRAKERNVRRHSVRNKTQVIALSKGLIDTFLEGLTLVEVAPIPQEETSSSADPDAVEPETVIVGMLANAATTYVKTVDLAISGYYPLAMSLVRLLGEHWVGAAYIRISPEGASLWEIDPATKRPRKTPSYGDMAKIVFNEPEVGGKMLLTRNTLHLFSHVNPVSFLQAFGLDFAGEPELHLGPSWDPEAFDRVMYVALWIGTQLFGEVEQSGGAAHEEWLKRAVEVKERVTSWMLDYNRRHSDDPQITGSVDQTVAE